MGSQGEEEARARSEAKERLELAQTSELLITPAADRRSSLSAWRLRKRGPERSINPVTAVHAERCRSQTLHTARCSAHLAASSTPYIFALLCFRPQSSLKPRGLGSEAVPITSTRNSIRVYCLLSLALSAPPLSPSDLHLLRAPPRGLPVEGQLPPGTKSAAVNF